jgi:ADP-ribosylglycohydrolase
LKAWEYEYEKRQKASPQHMEGRAGGWSGINEILKSRKAMLKTLWETEVPGSLAPESMFTDMVQAWYNRGYDVSEAEGLLVEADRALKAKNHGELERLTGRIQQSLLNAPKDESNSYWQFSHPEGWEDIKASFSKAAADRTGFPAPLDDKVIQHRIFGGWQGQIVGGAYGTAIEGYTGEALRKAYGDKLDFYVKEPETLNDDITYELTFLAAADENGKDFDSEDIADKWLKLIPFGWSAEYFALENLRRGIYPPESGRFGNFFSEWIGAQMRTMVCGLVAPADPLRAAEYACRDSVVSHEKNGIYGGIHSAVLTSLAFAVDDTRELLELSGDYLPEGSQFSRLFNDVMNSVKEHKDHLSSWCKISERLKKYNWVHTYPNMVAVVHALWYSEGSFDRALRILADCGMDVDCNAGEVGCAVGVMHPESISDKWTKPFRGILETYVPGYERMKITDLAGWTFKVYKKLL